MIEDFEQWLLTLRNSIADYRYYTDFEKVVKNANIYKSELYLLNSLIGSQDIEREFIELVTKYPNVVRVIPTLLAVRHSEIYADGIRYDFTHSRGDYCTFMRETGLFNLIQKHLVNNLYDYVLGVETGMDSNGRKNRGGHLMENLVEKYLADFSYRKEMTTEDIQFEYGLDMSAITNNGKSSKRFDFVVKTSRCVYAIECNFYTDTGSKLQETARSYKNIALESKDIPGFKFIWITDGVGWRKGKRGLYETACVLKDIYNISELENGVLKEILV